jgi:hypothetical protein
VRERSAPNWASSFSGKEDKIGRLAIYQRSQRLGQIVNLVKRKINSSLGELNKIFRMSSGSSGLSGLEPRKRLKLRKNGREKHLEVGENFSCFRLILPGGFGYDAIKVAPSPPNSGFWKDHPSWPASM